MPPIPWDERGWQIWERLRRFEHIAYNSAAPAGERENARRLAEKARQELAERASGSVSGA